MNASSNACVPAPPTAATIFPRQVPGNVLRFTADGPLNALPIDSDPIVVSPGGSGRGLGFAGTHSDVQLALAPLSAAAVRDYRARVIGAAAAAGRTAADLRILFVLKPEIVSSQAEAATLCTQLRQAGGSCQVARR